MKAIRISDRVRRSLPRRDTNWCRHMREAGLFPESVFKVIAIELNHTVHISNDKYNGKWDLSCFDLVDSKFEEYLQRLKSQ